MLSEYSLQSPFFGLLTTSSEQSSTLTLNNTIEGGVGGVVAWPMAHNRKVVGSSLVSAQLIPSPLAVIKANAGPLYMTT